MRTLAESSSTILLAVENKGARARIAETLQDHGYEVLVAVDTLDALQIGNKHEKPIVLLVTDLLVPGTSGHELTEVLNLKHPQMKALYLGHPTEPALTGTLRDSQAMYFGAWFTAERVLRRVREVLGVNVRTIGGGHGASRAA